MLNKYLIVNTTREERERIVLEALSDTEGCDDCVSDGDMEIYQPYIDGVLELTECTRAFRTAYVKGGMEQGPDTGCGFAR